MNFKAFYSVTENDKEFHLKWWSNVPTLRWDISTFIQGKKLFTFPHGGKFHYHQKYCENPTVNGGQSN